MASPAAEDAVKTGHGASPAREENDAPEDTESRTYKPSRSAEKYEGVTHEEYSSQIRKLVPDIAGNLNEIRAILIAAAQNLGIEVPRKATSDINIELLKPNNDAYNKEEVIDYQLMNLPSDELFRDNAAYNTTLDWRPLGKRVQDDFSPGQQPIFVWEIGCALFSVDINRVYFSPVRMQEFGYDSEGYVCLLHEEIHTKKVERIWIAAEGAEPDPTWKGQRFGKEWFIACHRAQLNPQQAAVILAQLGGKFRETKPASSFLDKFIHGWSTGTQHVWSRDSVSGQPVSVFQYHMRVITGDPPNLFSDDDMGIVLQRAEGVLAAPKSKKTMTIAEKRFSFALETTTGMDLPIFTLVNLSDCITASAGVTSLSRDRLHSVMEWKAANIRPWVRGNGVAAFAFRIHSWCGPWASEWGRLLDGIDNVSSVDLADILSHPKRLKIMFDDPGSEFALSEFYFAVLQLLRIAHDWIQESMDDLNTLVRTLEVDYMANVSKSSLLPGSSDLDQAATEVFRQNWEAVVSHQQRLAKELLNRIAKKQGEVSSLRDGLFNATSVSEATKSTQLNHYILVFTVVTIFYLPLSFVAALFALGLFSWDDPGQKTSFIATIAGVAGCTYLCSGLLVWLVRKSERQEMFKKAWMYMRGGFKWLLDHISRKRR